MSRNSDVWQTHEAVPRRTEETKLYPPSQKEAESQAPAELNQQEAEPREPEERQVEEEHRKALEEEAMEQVGRAEHLEEEHDPSPEEQAREWKEQREPREETSLPGGGAHAEVQGHLLLLRLYSVSSAAIGGMALFLKVEKASPYRAISLNVTCTYMFYMHVFKFSLVMLIA